MPQTIFTPPYSGNSVPGFGAGQSHVQNTWVTPVNDTVVIPELNPLPFIAQSDVLAIDTGITTYKVSIYQLALYIQEIVPVVPFYARVTDGPFNNIYSVQYFGANQTIDLQTMITGMEYGFYANGVDVLIPFTNGNLVGFTGSGTTTTQLISAGECLTFQRIAFNVVILR